MKVLDRPLPARTADTAPRVYTPISRCSIDGITRACGPALAEREGIECVVADLPPAFAGEADGAFLCGTACEILPVSPLDDHHYDVAGNAVTRRIVAGCCREPVRGCAQLRALGGRGR